MRRCSIKGQSRGSECQTRSKVAVSAAQRRSRRKVHALRFPDPEPSREIGLAWRKSAARKQDFVALGELLIEAMAGIEPKP